MVLKSLSSFVSCYKLLTAQFGYCYFLVGIGTKQILTEKQLRIRRLSPLPLRGPDSRIYHQRGLKMFFLDKITLKGP